MRNSPPSSPKTSGIANMPSVVQTTSNPNSAYRLLVVEDAMLLAADLEELLQKAGYSVVGPVPDLNSAISLIESVEIDAALLDIDLEGVKCFPAAKKLKEKTIPFAFLSGYDGERVVPEEFSHCPFIEKPFRQDLVHNIIRGLLKQ